MPRARGALARAWPEELRGRAAWVVLGCLVCQMGLGYGYVFGPLAKDLLDEFGWTRAEYAGMRLPQLALMAAASPLVGAWTVRFGARPVLVTSSALLGVAFAGVAGIGALWQLYALVMLQGLVVTGLGDISVGQVVARWATKSRGLALGIVYTGSNLGGAILTRLAAWLADHESWRAAFAILGLGGVAVMLPCALWLVRDRPPRAIEPSRVAAPEPAEGELDLRAALRTRSFWILAGTLFSFFFYFVGMLEHLVLFLTDQGMPRDEATAHFSNAILLGMASKVGFGWLADRIPHRAAMLLDYGLLALSSLLLLALPEPAFVVPFILCYGIATAARDVVTPLMIVECFGVRHLAAIYGAIMLALFPGGGFGPLFAAAVHDRTGSYDAAFAVFAAMNLVAFASLFWLRRERARAGRRGRVSAPVRPGYARFVLGLLFVVYVMNFVDRQILAILLDPIKQDLGVSDTAMGLLTGFAFAALYTVAGIPIARLADRGSRRTVIATGLAVWSAMTAASGLARSFGQLALARVGVGIGEAAGTPPSHSLLADYFPPERRAAALGFYANGIYVGTMLAFLFGGWVATRFDWRTAFLLVGLPGIPLALFVRFAIRELPRGASEGRAADDAEVPLGEALRVLFSRRTFRSVVLGGSLLSLTGYAMLVWGPAFLGRVHGMPPDAIGLWLGVLIGVAGSAGAWLGGLVADRLGRRDPRWTLRAPGLAMLAGLPFAAGFLLLPSPGAALACFAPFYLLSNMHVGPVWSALQGISRLRMRATALAVFQFILNLVGLGLGPLLVGMLNDELAERFGAGAIRWSLCIVTAIGAVGALFLLDAGRALPRDLERRDA